MKSIATSLLILLTMSVAGQRNFDDVQIVSTQLTSQVYMLTGAGGNIGVITGSDGIVMIDDQYAPLSDKIKAKLSELHAGPINYVINTHYHGDHTGGNSAMAQAGASILAHKNVRTRLAAERASQEEPSISEDALPILTFSDELELYTNDHSLIAIHVDRAHTDGDALVWIPEANVLHMGDCFFHKRYPYIDVDGGGSVVGLIKAVSAALMLASDDTQIIPGHGPMATKADLQDYYDFLLLMRDRMQTAMTSSSSAEDIDSDKITAGYESWSWGFIDADRLVSIFYNSLSEPTED